jgi:hypothetical protein
MFDCETPVGTLLVVGYKLAIKAVLANLRLSDPSE